MIRIKVTHEDGTVAEYEAQSLEVDNYDGVKIVVHPADGSIVIKDEIA